MPFASILRLHPADPVAVALADLAPGDVVGDGVTVRDAVPRGHKIALQPVAHLALLRKLGVPIGEASVDILAGEHVHTHNLAFRHVVVPPDAARVTTAPSMGPARSFDGFVRADGRVGTRNVLLVLATVNCAATVVRRIAETFRRRVDFAAWPSVDGVVGLVHQHGCSVRADGPGMATLRRTLAGYARHPNVAGVLVVGLGCEDNAVDLFFAASGLQNSARLRQLVIQDSGGTAATVEAGVEILGQMLESAATARRTPVSLRHLTVGLQCGGSDAFSAIGANPALGVAVDLLVAQGGCAILSETPEIYGAEQLLLARAASPAVADKLRALLRWWEDHASADQGTLDNNPSPGNKAGGITTILEKSLGAVAKSGSTPLRDVYAYAEPIEGPGVVFMDSPGYDPVSATGQIASGANLLCFTTGRGSCFGAAMVPSLKIATNTALAQRMAGDIDINCGTIVDGHETREAAGVRIFERMIDTASGRATKSEELGYGEDEFMPWTIGLTY